MNCERDVDFGALCCSRQAWIDCFGGLGDDDVDTILGDESIYESAVTHTRRCEVASEAAEGDMAAPECLTFEYFLEHKHNKD